MNLEAPRDGFLLSRDTSRNLMSDETALPTLRCLGGLRPDTMRVIAERSMKRRAVAKRPVDRGGRAGEVERVYVDLERDEQRAGRVIVGTENRLAADDDELIMSRHLSGGRDHVLEILTSQSAHLRQYPLPLWLAEHPSKWRVLTKIVGIRT